MNFAADEPKGSPGQSFVGHKVDVPADAFRTPVDLITNCEDISTVIKRAIRQGGGAVFKTLRGLLSHGQAMARMTSLPMAARRKVRTRDRARRES